MRDECLASALRLPGSPVFSGSALVYHTFQSLGYCSNDVTIPWKLGSLTNREPHIARTFVSRESGGLAVTRDGVGCGGGGKGGEGWGRRVDSRVADARACSSTTRRSQTRNDNDHRENTNVAAATAYFLLVEFGDVVPRDFGQPLGARVVHLALAVQNLKQR